MGRKEFSVAGLQKGRLTSIPEKAHTGLVCEYLKGRVGRSVQEEGEPQEPNQTGSWKTQNPSGHEIVPALALNSIWQYSGRFHFVYLFIFFLKERGDGGGGRELKLLLSISTLFNVCKVLLHSLTPELPEIIKEFENPAKNSKYLGDIRTYHCIWQGGHY